MFKDQIFAIIFYIYCWLGSII